MGITNAGLAMMGFQIMAEGDFLEACFHELHVFEMRGLVLGCDAGQQISGEIAGIPYQVGFGDSLNAICQNLVGDRFTDDEAHWVTERKANPPFGVIHLGPTAYYQCKAAFWKKEEDGSITTVDSFSGYRDEIAKQEAAVLPPLLAALECSFSANRHPVRFVPIEEARYGISKEGETVRNFRFHASGTLSASTGISPDDFSSTLNRAVRTASALDPRVAKFMHLGFQENDQLKKFLNFFLSIEIETHAVYKTIDHSKFLSDFVTSPSGDMQKTVTAFFSNQHAKVTSLKERFIWCVLCVWKHLNDDDVALFGRLKKTRDDIAHGNISAVPPGATQDAENLVVRLRNTQQ
jgi:hypothetical protein